MSRHLPRIDELDNVALAGINLGKSVKLALKARGMLQKELAAKLGISEGSMTHIANRASGSSSTINAVAAALGMKPSELIALGEE